MKEKVRKDYKTRIAQKLKKIFSVLQRKQSILLAGFLSLCIILFLSAFFFSYYAGRIYPRVYVFGINLSGKTIEESHQLLYKHLEQRFPQSITLSYQNRRWPLSTASVSAGIDYQQTTQDAFSYGRKGTVLGNLQAITTALISKTTLPIRLFYNKEALSQSIATLAAEIDIPVEEPTLLVTKTSTGKSTIELTKGRNGRKLNIDETAQHIIQRFHLLSAEELSLPIQELLVETTEEQRKQAIDQAEKLLTKTLEIKTPETSLKLDGKDLIPFIDVKTVYNREKIASWAATLANQVNHPPQDAVFQFSGNKVNVFKPSKDGITLDENKTTNLVAQRLSDLEATISSTLELTVPIKTTPPKVSTAQANNLGIKELLGRGISYYGGSAAERIHNLSLLTSKLNGVLIPPGETFSVDRTVGDISTATGYKQAFIIQNGRTILGDGGGVCQPTTTLFRAVINSGLPVEERHAHAYRVHYYEDGGFQPGFDATIFLPQVDFKFKNDMASYILIQAYTVPSELKLVFELYGTKDNREIYISPGRIWDQAPAPPTLYQDDPTLPKGVMKQVDFAAPGAKAAFDYKVTKDGKTIQERTFFSNFRPWQAIFLKGTKE